MNTNNAVKINNDFYKMTFDYHTHTIFSHGKGTIEDNVKVAKEKGIKAIAISDHGPGHKYYGIKRTAIKEMRKEIDRLNKIYDVDIFLSVEANIIDANNGLDLTKEEQKEFDFIIAGYHYGIDNGRCNSNWLYNKNLFFGSKRKKDLEKFNTNMTVKSLYENDIKILTHPGDKGPFNMKELAKACAETNTLMEISTHHRNLTLEEIKICKNFDVSFVISSDAHIPYKVGNFEDGLLRAEKAGLDLSRIVNVEKI